MQKYSHVKRIIKKSTQLFGAVFFLPLFFSCNKEFDNRLVFDNNADTTIHKTSDLTKVLYIMVDGGVGKSIIEQSQKDDLYPSLYAITLSSIFTGNSVSDESNNIASTYADMLTGVTKAKHQVSGSGNNNLENYRMFFSNLKQENQNWRTAAFTTSSFLHDELIKDADVNTLLQTDAEVKDATIEELKNPDAAIVLTQFKGLQEAGDQYGFGSDVPQYLDAIKQLDSYLGELMVAYRSRSTYNSEKWLIVIASNKGGTYALQPGEDDQTVFSETDRNNFVIFSNDRFAFQYIQKPNTKNPQYEGSYVRFDQGASGYGEIDAANAAIYNMGTTGDFTVQLKIKIDTNSRPIDDNGEPVAGNPPIIAKADNTGNSTSGWSFLLTNANSQWRMQLTGASQSSGVKLLDDTWYTLTGKLYMVDGVRKIKVFTNGVPSGESNMTGNGTSSAPLRIGHSITSYGSGASKHIITDIRIYNTALPDVYIQNNYCSTLVSKDDPYYNNLIGYWPAITPNVRGTFVDQSPNKRDFKLTDNLKWEPFSFTDDNICPTLPDNMEKLIPSTVDIPLFIYSWMGVKNISNLNLDGKSWLPTYVGI